MAGVVRMSEVLSALSYALDIVEGQPEGHALRSCMIGMRLGEEIGLDPAQRSALFYALLLKDLGCSSNAAKVSYLFGADDRVVKNDLKTTDWTSVLQGARYVLRNVTPEGSARERLGRFVRVAGGSKRTSRELIQIRCDRGSAIAVQLGLPDETASAIRHLDELWDGRGHPEGLRGEKIPLLARILCIAQTLEVFWARDGVEGAAAIARKRRGSWFDPQLVGAFESVRQDGAFWTRVGGDRIRREVVALEPDEMVMDADGRTLDRICESFSQVIDAKSPWTARHSQGVSDVAVGIAGVMGLREGDRRRLRRAGLLHDIGKLGVSNTILDKPGRLTGEELVAMRLHPAYTLRILERASCFHDIADLAASHHERLDGKGYFRGLTGDQMDTPARILVVADIYEALAAKRPYREDLTPEDVMKILDDQAGEGVCPRALEGLKAFLAASGFVPYELPDAARIARAA